MSAQTPLPHKCCAPGDIVAWYDDTNDVYTGTRAVVAAVRNGRPSAVREENDSHSHPVCYPDNWHFVARGGGSFTTYYSALRNLHEDVEAICSLARS